MIRSKKLSSNKIAHGFFNKLGGTSRGIYKSLNCGLGSKDKKTFINKNLKIVKKKLSKKSSNIYLAKQIHSSKYIYIDKNYSKKLKRIEADAIITSKKLLPIGVLTADCVPILIADKRNTIVAAIHSGWKGAHKGIIEKVIKFLKKKGYEPENLIAAIGPCISQKNYEVKDDFKKKFLKKDKKYCVFFKNSNNKIFFNLRKFVQDTLKNNGIKSIDIINKDTFDISNNYFSARRSISLNQDDYGRNISLIMIN